MIRNDVEIASRLSSFICDECYLSEEEGCTWNSNTCAIFKEELKWLNTNENLEA